jgi:hypothetical protein
VISASSIVESETTDVVDVSPGASGSIRFIGAVDVENDNSETPMNVELNAQSTVGQATIDPSQMVFWGSGSQDFTVTVQVPLATPRQPAQLTVYGTWSQEDTTGTVGSSQAAFIIAGYSDFDVNIDNSVVTIKQGESGLLPLNISNQGNCRDEFSIDILNRKELEENGIQAVELPQVWIEMNESKIINLIFSPEKTATMGTFPVELQVNSMNMDSSSSVNTTVYITVEKGDGEGNENGGNEDDSTSSDSSFEKFYLPLLLLLIITCINSIILGFVLMKRRKEREE